MTRTRQEQYLPIRVLRIALVCMALATGTYVHAQDIDCPVEASHASSFRSDPFLLTLSCSLPYAHVHYTVDGIQFTFPNITVSPGDYIVLAKDPDVFSEHHVCDCPVLGPYNGVLKNSGEILELRTGDNRTVHVFEYKDTWYSSTDGLGYSLIVLDPTGVDPSQWGHKAHWSPSFVLDGTPGRPY